MTLCVCVYVCVVNNITVAAYDTQHTHKACFKWVWHWSGCGTGQGVALVRVWHWSGCGTGQGGPRARPADLHSLRTLLQHTRVCAGTIVDLVHWCELVHRIVVVVVVVVVLQARYPAMVLSCNKHGVQWRVGGWGYARLW